MYMKPENWTWNPQAGVYEWRGPLHEVYVGDNKEGHPKQSSIDREVGRHAKVVDLSKRRNDKTKDQ